MYQDVCPGIMFEEEYREGFMVGLEDAVVGIEEEKGLVSEYGYYGLGYSDGIESSKKPKNTSRQYYNQ